MIVIETVKLASYDRAATLTTRVFRSSPDPETEHRWRSWVRSTARASHFVGPEYFLDRLVRDGRLFAILAGRRAEIAACLTGSHDRGRRVGGMPTHPQLFKKEFGGVLHPMFRVSLDRSLFAWRDRVEAVENYARRVARRGRNWTRDHAGWVDG